MGKTANVLLNIVVNKIFVQYREKNVYFEKMKNS